MTAEAEKNKNLKLFEDSLQELSGIVEGCRSQFYQKLKLVELQDAIARLDRDMLLYPGKAKEQLDELRSRSTKILRWYDNCVKPILLSSVSVGKTLTSFLAVAESRDLVASDKEILWSMIVQSLNKSKPNITKSMDSLSILKAEVVSLKVLFTLLGRHIKDDYTTFGMCSRAKQDLRARDQRAKEHVNYIKEMKDFMKGMYIAALSFVTKKPVPKEMEAKIEQTIDFSLENKELKSSKDLIKMIDGFLKHLQDKMADANKLVDEVLASLDRLRNNFREVRPVESVVSRHTHSCDITRGPQRPHLIHPCIL